eukprot:SAG11_NODE_10_length_27955_cov_15.365235_12_plen_316_part_00
MHSANDCCIRLGKTVISSWLVRQAAVREKFQKIAWVALGQTPNPDEVQESLFTQLTNQPWDSDASQDKKKMTLQAAFANTNILLVLDDAWEAQHESLLNFVDPMTTSKVLISSRVRKLLVDGEKDEQHTTAIVDINLPSEDDAVKMLVSTACLTLDEDQPLPPEAKELVQLCNLLPLGISIAGSLIREASSEEGNQATGCLLDWAEILQMLKDEFAENDNRQSMEETVIATSIKAIKGSQRENIIQLFKSLALVAEDTACPLSITAMVFEACESTEPAMAQRSIRPSITQTRRWLKALIDRSLVLGTVDRPRCYQ